MARASVHAVLVAAALLSQQQAVATLVVDTYGNDDGGTATSTAFAFSSSTFAVTRSGWVSSYALKTGVSPDASVVARLVTNKVATVPGSNGTLSNSGGVEWRTVALPVGIPVEANTPVDVTSTTAGSAYTSAVMQGSCDAVCSAIVAVTVSVRSPAANLSTANGTAKSVAAGTFTSDYIVVPFDGYLTDYTISTDHPGLVFATAYSIVGGQPVQAYFRQMPGIRPSRMRGHPIGIARYDWVPVKAGSLMYVQHRDEGNLAYFAETNGAADSARVTMTFRPQETVDTYSNVPATGEEIYTLGTSFFAGPWSVTLPGFLDSVDVLVASMTSTNPRGVALQCTLTVNVTRGGTSANRTASGMFETRFAASTTGPNTRTNWQGASLVPSLALYAGDALHVSHSCGGTQYTSAVTPAGQAVVTFGVARAPAQ